MPPTLFDDPPRPPEGDGGGPDEAPPDAPLADRMRPRDLDEVLGQQGLVGEEGVLARALAADRVPSLILWGPPGSGKTTIARILARRAECRFVPFSAVTSGIREVRRVMEEAERWRRAASGRTLLFVDEIHRFNRAQQDAFLPYVERGDIVLIGATTENPSFELNAALLSRCRVAVLDPLDDADVGRLLDRALGDAERGLGDRRLELGEAARAALVQLASGDARRALNLLESAALDVAERGARRIDAATVSRVAQRKVLLHDKSGDRHFQLISALHKSLRESDPDAAVYWLARMLEAGEEPLYAARRMVRFASEDVGLADPQALPQALAGWDAYRRLGSPEGELALAQVAIYLALAPKSHRAYRALGRARRAVAERPADPVPEALRNAPTRLTEELGWGRGYVYAHDTEEGVGGLRCLPDALAGERFYEPGKRGFEAELGRRLERFREAREKAAARRREEEAGRGDDGADR